jgi:hypothetical protein
VLDDIVDNPATVGYMLASATIKGSTSKCWQVTMSNNTVI